MHKRFDDAFSKLEKTKAEIMIVVSKLTEEDYRKNRNNKWSIAQILTHILTSEELALSYMKKKYLGVDHLRNASWVEPSKLLLLQLSQRLPIRYKAPESIVEKTPAPLSFNELSERWSASRANLKNFLSAIPDAHVRKMIFKHPIAGMFDAVRGVMFLREHLLHHIPQIKRNL